MFLPVKKILTIQSRSICCTTIKSNGLLRLNTTICTTPKRYVFKDYFSVGIQTKISELMEKFQIMSPLNKSVSTYPVCNLNINKTLSSNSRNNFFLNKF